VVKQDPWCRIFYEIAQFGFKACDIHIAILWRDGAINLTIDAVEIADLVGVEVDPHGQAT